MGDGARNRDQRARRSGPATGSVRGLADCRPGRGGRRARRPPAAGRPPGSLFRSGGPRLAERHGHRRHRAATSPTSTGGLQVFEDGVKQDVTFFTRRNLPIALALLIDTSASMEARLQTAQEAAIGFVRQAADAGPRRDHRLRQPRHHRRSRSRTTGRELEQAIRRTSAGGSTSLYNAIYIALKELKKLVAHRRPRRSGGRRSSCSRTAKTRRACCRSKRCSISPSAPRPRSTPSVCAAARLDRTARASRRPSSCCGSCAGNRRAGVLPRSGVTELAKSLRADLRRAVEPVHGRLHVAESGRNGRRLAPHRRPRQRPN